MANGSTLSKKDFITNVETNDDSVTDSEVVLDYAVQEVMSNEPLFGVGDTSLLGYQTFKMYDQYSGHMARSTPKDPGSDDDGWYAIEKSGKMYQSGKTYYVGYSTYAKAQKKDNNNK